MVKNPPSNAGDVGLIPGRRTKIPHAMGQLSLCATTTELMRLNERAHVPANYRAHALWSPPATTTELTCLGAHTSQLERSPCPAMKMQRSQKKKKENKEIFFKNLMTTLFYLRKWE